MTARATVLGPRHDVGQPRHPLPSDEPAARACQNPSVAADFRQCRRSSGECQIKCVADHQAMSPRLIWKNE